MIPFGPWSILIGCGFHEQDTREGGEMLGVGCRNCKMRDADDHTDTMQSIAKKKEARAETPNRRISFPERQVSAGSKDPMNRPGSIGCSSG